MAIVLKDLNQIVNFMIRLNSKFIITISEFGEQKVIDGIKLIVLVYGDQPAQIRPQIEIDQIEHQLSKKFEYIDILRNHIIHCQKWAIKLGITYQGPTGNQFRIDFDRSILPSTNSTGWYRLRDEVAFANRSNFEGDAYYNYQVKQDDEQHLQIARGIGPEDPTQNTVNTTAKG